MPAVGQSLDARPADVSALVGTFAGLRSEESALPSFRSATERIGDAYDQLCR